MCIYRARPSPASRNASRTARSPSGFGQSPPPSHAGQTSFPMVDSPPHYVDISSPQAPQPSYQHFPAFDMQTGDVHGGFAPPAQTPPPAIVGEYPNIQPTDFDFDFDIDFDFDFSYYPLSPDTVGPAPQASMSMAPGNAGTGTFSQYGDTTSGFASDPVAPHANALGVVLADDSASQDFPDASLFATYLQNMEGLTATIDELISHALASDSDYGTQGTLRDVVDLTAVPDTPMMTPYDHGTPSCSVQSSKRASEDEDEDMDAGPSNEDMDAGPSNKKRASPSPAQKKRASLAKKKQARRVKKVNASPAARVKKGRRYIVYFVTPKGLRVPSPFYDNEINGVRMSAMAQLLPDARHRCTRPGCHFPPTREGEVVAHYMRAHLNVTAHMCHDADCPAQYVSQRSHDIVRHYSSLHLWEGTPRRTPGELAAGEAGETGTESDPIRIDSESDAGETETESDADEMETETESESEADDSDSGESVTGKDKGKGKGKAVDRGSWPQRTRGAQ